MARRLRAGRIFLNGAPNNPVAPFGGYQQSGNGREWGVFGLETFLEIKAVLGQRPGAWIGPVRVVLWQDGGRRGPRACQGTVARSP